MRCFMVAGLDGGKVSRGRLGRLEIVRGGIWLRFCAGDFGIRMILRFGCGVAWVIRRRFCMGDFGISGYRAGFGIVTWGDAVC